MVVRLAYFAQVHAEDVTAFASNLISSIPEQNLSKRFFDMFIKVFKVANIAETSKVCQVSLKAKNVVCVCSVESHKANSC